MITVRCKIKTLTNPIKIKNTIKHNKMQIHCHEIVLHHKIQMNNNYKFILHNYKDTNRE